MSTRTGRLITVLSGLFFYNCSNGWGKFWNVINADANADLISFSINGQYATISGTSARLVLRWTSLTNLVATFSISGSKATVNGVTQLSGQTANDFSSAKTYVITAADGTTKSYNVAVSVYYPVSDTGLLNCYDTTLQTCATVAATYPRQDGMLVDIPAARSFVGPTQHALYTNDYTTKDNVTGLVWKTCSEGLSGPTCATGSAGAISWSVANDGINCATNLNSTNSGAGYAGLTNWRLPTLEELRTLVNHSLATAIDSAAFPGTPAAQFWTASNYLPNTTNGWYFSFSTGFANSGAKATAYVIRCVSGGTSNYSLPLVDNNDGTVTDQSQGLVWTKCSMDNSGTGTLQTHASACANLPVGGRNWQQSLQDCNNLTLAGKSWRLPSSVELMTITDLNRSAPAINPNYFPNATAAQYWSSTTNIGVAANAWNVNFADGVLGNTAKSNTYYVRCVSGP